MTQTTHTAHSIEDIFFALVRADVSAVASHEGTKIKQRQMHFAPNDDLSIYFASMKGDPKTIQITNDSSVSVLILDRSGEMGGWSETEISGDMRIVTDEAVKKRAAEKLYTRSPIVKNLMDSKMEYILDWIVLTPSAVKFRVFGEIVQGVPPTYLEFKKSEGASMYRDVLRVWELVMLWMRASRALFLTATALPVALGIAVAYYSGVSITWSLATLTMLSGLALHLSANILNDYMDHVGGSDAVNTDYARPFSGGSRVIQLGVLSPVAMLLASMLSGGLGLLIGLYLAYVSGPAVLLLGVIGALVVLLYSLPRYGLAYNGLGEIAIGLVFGPLVTLGAYYVQTQSFSWLPVVASIPLAGMIALVLFVNEFPDMKADKTVGKRTLVVRMGLSTSSSIYIAVGTLSFIAMLYAMKVEMVPPLTMGSLVALPFIFWGWRTIQKNLGEPRMIAPACGATVSAHMLVGVGLVIAFVVSVEYTQTSVFVGEALLVLLTAWFAYTIYNNKRAFEQASKTFKKT